MISKQGKVRAGLYRYGPYLISGHEKSWCVARGGKVLRWFARLKDARQWVMSQ